MSTEYELEELNKSSESSIPEDRGGQNQPSPAIKPRAYVVIAGAVGILCYFLPWIKLSIMGFEFYSVIGLDIPTTADMVGQWTVSLGRGSGGLSILSVLYIVPFLFATIIGLELLRKTKYLFLVGIGVLFLLVAFLVAFIYNTGFNEGLNLLGIGFYGSLIAGTVAVFSKKG